MKKPESKVEVARVRRFKSAKEYCDDAKHFLDSAMFKTSHLPNQNLYKAYCDAFDSITAFSRLLDELQTSEVM